MRWEGGSTYTNNPKDPGGPTKYGITIATLSHDLGRKATIGEVANMTIETASAIYRKKFWNTIDGDRLANGVDMIAFDIAVNSGPGRALNWLSATYALSNNPRSRIMALDKMRRGFWRHLGIFPFFGKGWFRRENDVFSNATQLAG
jgi:lysozyme family protein